MVTNILEELAASSFRVSAAQNYNEDGGSQYL
jgi:hypothetical protein